MAWWTVAGSLLKDVTVGWFGHKKAKTEAKREIELKRISGEMELDAVSASDMSSSWKDELLTVLFSVPVAVVFYAAVWGDPADIDRVKSAFSAMNELPEWYHWVLIGIVTGTFGLRGLRLKK